MLSSWIISGILRAAQQLLLHLRVLQLRGVTSGGLVVNMGLGNHFGQKIQENT